MKSDFVFSEFIAKGIMGFGVRTNNTIEEYWSSLKDLRKYNFLEIVVGIVEKQNIKHFETHKLAQKHSSTKVEVCPAIIDKMEQSMAYARTCRIEGFYVDEYSAKAHVKVDRRCFAVALVKKKTISNNK